MYFFAIFTCSSLGTVVDWRAISTLPRTVFQGIKAKVWNITPILGLGAVIGWPWNRTRPEVGWSSPSIIRRSVLFPHPEGPTIHRNSLETLKLISSNTVVLFPSPGETLATSLISRRG